MEAKLGLDGRTVRRARSLARRATAPVVELARTHTTVSVERAVLRLAGMSGTDPTLGNGEIPWVNRVVDTVREQVGLEHGIALPVWHELRTGGHASLDDLADKVGSGSVRFIVPQGVDRNRAARAALAAARLGLRKIDRKRREREALVKRIGDPQQRPWIYLIVATGDIYEDIPQAQAAARAGADVVAVIRSTGQSLLDYVPEGAPGRGTPGPTRRRRTSG